LALAGGECLHHGQGRRFCMRVCAWMSCSNHELKGETTPRASTLAHHEHEYAPISEEAGTLATSLWPLARGTLR
jgi:hypothetical protein